MQVPYKLFIFILFTLILSTCAPDPGEQSKKFRNVSLSMDYSNPSSRFASKINEDLLMGIGTEVIYLVSDSVGFEKNYQKLVSFEDRALTDNSNNKVLLTLPLDTSLKIYAYRFTEQIMINGLDGQSKTPVSYGKSGSFIISESTSSLTISLSITPNGTPGLEITPPTVSIDNQGGNATFSIKLKTQPKETVTLPISIDNISIAILSSTSLRFTPLNWNTSQTVTLTGNTSTNYSDNVTLETSLGPSKSEDIDYVNLNSSFRLSSTGFPFTPDNLTATTGDGIINLDWNPVTNATGYNIYYDGMSGVTSSDTLIAGVTDDNYTLREIPNNTAIFFRVAAVNSNGISTLSNEISATPSANSSSSDNLTYNDSFSWSDNFTQGSSATSSQINRYNIFWDNISVSDNWSRISIGNPDNLISCDNASEIITNYKANTTNAVSCNGKNWQIGACGSGRSITVGSSGVCHCLQGEVWTVRPTIGNANWGGVGKECSASSQTLEILLERQNPKNVDTDNLSRGLVAHFRFNGNANDYTSNANHGTVNGATLTSGKDNVPNTAYSFNGTNNKITIANNSLFNFNKNDNLSFSVWVYPESFEELNGIFSKYQSASDDDLFLRVNDSSGGLKFGSGLGSITISNALNLNQWQNIIITVSNGSTQIFINGVLKKSGNTSWNQTANYFSLGCDYCEDGSSDTKRFFDGKIDKLRIYNRIIKSTEINSLYTKDNTISLVAWAYWNLNDSSGSDNISSRDLSIIGKPSEDNSTWSLTGNGIYGEYQLNSNDNIDNFSVSLRIKIANDAEKHDSVISSSKSSGILGSWQIGMTGNTSIKFSSKQSSGNADSGDLLLSKNTWHHLVLTKSASNEINIYKNNSLSDTLQLNDWTVEWIRIGTNRNTANFWKGNVDDVRIYDYVLSKDNINTLYQIY